MSIPLNLKFEEMFEMFDIFDGFCEDDTFVGFRWLWLVVGIRLWR